MRLMLAFAMVLLLLPDLHAQRRRDRRMQVQQPVTQEVVAATVVAAVPAGGATECDDALAEVNAERAKRGLRAYVNDPVLNEAARKCAAYRASRLCSGHCDLPQGDFTFLSPVYPVGSCVGGCAAWTPDWGWGACATYENYTYCGAAWKLGSDGKRYMHLFCR